MFLINNKIKMFLKTIIIYLTYKFWSLIQYDIKETKKNIKEIKLV